MRDLVFTFIPEVVARECAILRLGRSFPCYKCVSPCLEEPYKVGTARLRLQNYSINQ